MNAPVKAAMIGAGAWAAVLTKAAAHSQKIQFVCCAGRNPEKLTAFAQEAGIPSRSIDDVLSDKGIDAVALAVPNDVHLPLAERSARAGKHIFVEKPIANTMADGLRVARLEQDFGVRITVGHCARLLVGNRLIRQAIDRDELGEVSQVEANFSNNRGLRLTLQDWRWYSASSPGGSLSQLAIHLFDTLRFLGGDIVEVSAAAARQSPVGAEVEDQWIVTAHFADGKLGTIISSWVSPGTFSVRVTGTKALMAYDIDQNYWATPERLHENATLYLQAHNAGPGGRRSVAVPQGNMFRDELEIFADYVANGGDCELSAANGCAALAGVYAALKSAAHGGRRISLAEIIDESR